MTSIIDKRIIIGLAVILFFGAAVFFRDSVSRFLHFGPEIAKPGVSEIKEASPQIITPPAGESPSYTLEEVSTENAADEGRSLPPYSGRDPAEVQPAEEEVRLIPQEQREILYRKIRELGAAVKNNLNFLNGWNELGLLKKMIGDYEGARDAWEYASAIRPKNSLSFANLGELYWRYLPDYPRAEKNFKTSIKNKSNDPDIYISLSELYSYSYKEKAHLADDALLEGLAANPGDVNLMRALASLYERQKEYAKAIEWWQKVLENEPGNKEVAATIEALKQKKP